ncbi:alkylglycerol monooxygenase [Eurytemora carolleeae]|uniref:alkylglycerol monooxygenase n=1 Tax=Eurytemora carolleeae TaxID=1294199 RepID=UPI000C787E07|nr:alkylglycerol monooxygenase [Eurytemora carolleeae]|eukprot:XP_023330407.1 alkylglycerol monooxygenase-like [Eurytemora affinis]
MSVNVSISIEDDVLDSVGSLFYLVSPWKHTFYSIEDCPDHLDRALPYMIFLIVLEALISLVVQGKKYNMADSLTNVNIGVLMVLAGLVSKFAMLSTYSWVHQHYRVLDLNWDSVYVWVLAAVAVDCGYYWFHRASHEIGFLWAVHQVHHSSEEFNLTTAFRQPILEGLGWITHWFYLPCALLIPTPQMLVHSELNFLYQFWIHTELVGNLGPLELIFNTATQHKVHHGTNRSYQSTNEIIQNY